MAHNAKSKKDSKLIFWCLYTYEHTNYLTLYHLVHKYKVEEIDVGLLNFGKL